MKPITYSKAAFTKNLNQFTFIDANRPLHTSDDLRKSLQQFGYIHSSPILVNPKMQVLDGQNRLSICQELGIGVWFVTAHTANQKQDYELIIAINKNQSVWRLSEYIHHYATRGVKFHCEVRDFEERYKLGISNSISLCSVFPTVSPAREIRKGQDLKLNPNRNKCAEFIINCSLSFKKTSPFVKAIGVLFSKASDAQIKKLNKSILVITHQPTIKHYLAVFENIINRKARGDNQITLVVTQK